MGKPVIKGTRISVELILKRFSENASIEELLSAYPNLTRDDILSVLAYSADAIGNERSMKVLIAYEISISTLSKNSANRVLTSYLSWKIIPVLLM
jgi:uncharacterized protein (DUF433 family)